jgi:hypothetical protein
MPYLIQDLCNRARIPLNDDDDDDTNRRYPDATKLLPYAKSALETALRIRPDLFIGVYATSDFSALALTDAFPIEGQFLQVFADYITARVEGVDDEHMDSGRARRYYELFLAG